VNVAGLHRSENPGMSNDKTGENPVRRKSKGSWEGSSAQGKPEPKVRPKGVADGETG